MNDFKRERDSTEKRWYIIIAAVGIAGVVMFINNWAPPKETIITTEELRLYEKAANEPKGTEAQYLKATGVTVVKECPPELASICNQFKQHRERREQKKKEKQEAKTRSPS